MKHWTNWPIAIAFAAILAACSDGGPLGPAGRTTEASLDARTASPACTAEGMERDPRIQIPDEDASTEGTQDGCSEDERPVLDPRIHTGETSG